MSLSLPLPKAVGCHTCQRMSRDDGSWNKWTDPKRTEYHVCHICFSSPRRAWREEFLLYEKARFGTVHMPRGLPVTTTDLEHRIGFVQRYLCGEVSKMATSQDYQKTKQPYRYSSLNDNQIRILSILPGDTDDDICCILEHVDIDTAKTLKYEALSYRWEESPEMPSKIWINSCTFVVSHKLFIAMCCLRMSKIPRKIWIDAISINQANDTDGMDEKKVQISLMGKIYRFAYEVVIWLGPAADGSDKVMDVIANSDVDAMQSPEFAEGFWKLLCRSWFYRTWIVQEFVLGKYPPKMVCGTKSITSAQSAATHGFMLDLGKLSMGQSTQLEDEPPTATQSKTGSGEMNPSETEFKTYDAHPLSTLLDLRSAALDDDGNLRPGSLAGILRYYRLSQVTDMRDKVHGTLGLVDESVHDFIKADSNKSIAEVHTDAMTYMLTVELENYDLEIILLFLTFPCSLSLMNPITDMPSWVPDFSRNDPFLSYDFQFTWFWLYQITRNDSRKPFVKHQHGRHRVTVDRVDRSSVQVQGKTLRVKGLAVDELTAVQPSAFYADFPQDIDSAIEKMFGQSGLAKTAKELIQPLQDAYTSIPEIKTGEDTNLDPNIVLTTLIRQMGQTMTLLEIEKICRKQMTRLESNTHPDEWMFFIWRDLFEGFNERLPLSERPRLSEEQFQLAFHSIVGTSNPTIFPDWFSMDGKIAALKTKAGSAGAELETVFMTLFKAPRCFFMTQNFGLYGIAPPGVKAGDKLVFLMPPLYIAFILRPYNDAYQMVGPCFIPPRSRDRYMEKISASGRLGRPLDEFVIH